MAYAAKVVIFFAINKNNAYLSANFFKNDKILYPKTR